MRQFYEAQYRASLAMMRDAIVQCPDEFWNDPAYDARFWRVVYHALSWTHYYLAKTAADFVRWPHGVPNAWNIGLALDPLEDGTEPVNTRREMLDFIDAILAEIPGALANDDFEAPSGYPWIPVKRLHLHPYSIRHLEHHVGQLAERLRLAGHGSPAWVPTVVVPVAEGG